jgi:transketolase
MWAAMEHHGPTYLRLTRDPSPVITPRERPFAIGRTYALRQGTDVTLISTGVQTVRTLEAAEILAADGISTHVLHVPTLKPLAETLSEHRPTLLRRVGVRDVFGESAPNAPLLEKYGLTPKHVAQTARDLVG